MRLVFFFFFLTVDVLLVVWASKKQGSASNSGTHVAGRKSSMDLLLRYLRESLMHAPYLELVVAIEQCLIQQVAHDLGAGGHGVNKIAAYQPGLGLIPKSHSAGAAHGEKWIEESATGVDRDALLDSHQARVGGQGADFSAVLPGARVHGTHHRHGGPGQAFPNRV